MSTVDFPRTVEEIHADFLQRRNGLLKALTDDVEEFYQQCDPEKDNLCLYGHRDGTWVVDLPADEVPPELPEPCLGINFARDGMLKKDWLALVAVHSDSWLMAVAFFYAVKLDAAGRMRLFKMMNQLPTLFEIVTNRVAARPKSGQEQAKKKKVLSFGANRPTESPYPSGKLMRPDDLNPTLKGRLAELFWPDDKMWYLVEIQAINLKTKAAKIQYATGEVEELDMEEILRDNHMHLL